MYSQTYAVVCHFFSLIDTYLKEQHYVMWSEEIFY